MRVVRTSSTASAPAGDGPSDDVRPGLPGPSWGFWVGLVTAACPLLVAVGMAHLLLTSTNPRFQPWGPGDGPVTSTDRWALLLATSPPGWTALLSALTALVLTAAATTGRPRWMRGGTTGAWALAAVGAATVLLALGGVGLHAWNAVRAPTALEAGLPGNSAVGTLGSAWLLDASMGVTAVLLGVLVTVLAVRHATLSGGPREPGGRTVGG